MNNHNLIGVDLAKSSFQIHVADEKGKALNRKKLSRNEFDKYLRKLDPSTIYMEACGTANFWGRTAQKLGHTVHLIAPQYVKPFVKRQKTDAADAEAIVEAGSRANMNFVSVKTVAQQDIQSLLRIRQRHVESRTALMNQTRGLLAEYGITVKKGQSHLYATLIALSKEDHQDVVRHDLSSTMYGEVQTILEELRSVDERIAKYDMKLEQLSETDDRCRRLQTIPGVGPVTSATIVAAIGDAKDFNSARQLAAWTGLTPRQHSTGGNTRMLGISKAGNKDLRTLLIHGGRTVLINSGKKIDPRSVWAEDLKARVGMNKAAVAMAHKNIRMVYAILKNGTVYDPRHKPKVPKRRSTI